MTHTLVTLSLMYKLKTIRVIQKVHREQPGTEVLKV